MNSSSDSNYDKEVQWVKVPVGVTNDQSNSSYPAINVSDDPSVGLVRCEPPGRFSERSRRNNTDYTFGIVKLKHRNNGKTAEVLTNVLSLS